MVKYTELNEALQDPTLVILTDNIKTAKELNIAYLKYKRLPSKQKRYSNYYSNLFLGHNVPKMYQQMKEKLTADNDPLSYYKQLKIPYQGVAETGAEVPNPEAAGVKLPTVKVPNIELHNVELPNIELSNVELPSEKYAHTEPDLYYKEASFNSGETQLCFILGHSGSGKSRMASTLEGENINHIELDDLLLVKDHFTKDELADYSDMFAAFFDGVGAKYYIGLEERDSIPKEEYEDKVFVDFVNFAFDYSKAHPDKKYIVEGIWIYLYFDDPSLFDDYAVFIKGTSFLKSKIRVAKREAKRDKAELVDRKQMFGRETRNYLLDENKIDKYRDYFSGKPETIFREETPESDKIEEEVIEELKKINECFVNEDANGIVEIKKNAEANARFSNWQKLMIVAECEQALFEI